MIAPLHAGGWWHLDLRPGACESRPAYKFPQRLCNIGGREFASMFTVVYPQRGTVGSDVIRTLIPRASQTIMRSTRMGAMTHCGFTGESDYSCGPPNQCGETATQA